MKVRDLIHQLNHCPLDMEVRIPGIEPDSFLPIETIVSSPEGDFLFLDSNIYDPVEVEGEPLIGIGETIKRILNNERNSLDYLKGMKES